jgi:CubicO group peptidase (beta-lactamase class C family)
MKTSKPLLIALCFLSHFTIAQTVQTARLDSLFNLLETKNKTMASVRMTRAGEVIYEKSIGYAEITDTNKKRATPDTKYRIGSITKTFTSAMIMQLVEEKKLELTTTLDKFFPTVANSGQITMRMLLSHRSGIHNYTNDDSFWKIYTKFQTADEMTAMVTAMKSDFKPDERTEYSNSNYVLLGWIIEKITGKSYADNLQTRINAKLGLKNTRFAGKTDISKNDSYSYKFEDNKWTKNDESDLSLVLAAGAIIATPSDLTTFIDGLFAGKLVSAESLEQMKSVKDGMGLGLIQVPFYNMFGYGHNGGLDAFQSGLYYFPDDKLAVTICSNGTSYAINDLAIALLSAYYQKPFEIPNLDITGPTAAEIQSYLGTYASAQMPLKVTISEKDGNLMAQGSGQPAFPLTKSADHTFKFSQAAITIIFRPQLKELTLNQAGTDYIFKMD